MRQFGCWSDSWELFALTDSASSFWPGLGWDAILKQKSQTEIWKLRFFETNPDWIAQKVGIATINVLRLPRNTLMKTSINILNTLNTKDSISAVFIELRVKN